MKKNKLFLSFLMLVALPFMGFGQLERVILETYYVSDAADATDTIGGTLEEGSTTYRIYVDLEKGAKLKAIYGDEKHPLKFNSSAYFFNNIDRGASFGKEINGNRLDENTVALDTWLTLGLATKSHYGVLKTQDSSGSFIGGANNDGGSAEISEGLLKNTSSEIGIALTDADGLEEADSLPENFIDFGFEDILSGNDSSIFGAIVKDSSFFSTNATLQNSGTVGLTSDNIVLIGQLTTKGEITFEINLIIADSNNIETKFIADSNGVALEEDEKISRYLKYPFQLLCGCHDPNYLEYVKSRDCDDSAACKTLAILGCTDTTACNFDANANFNIPQLCCYSVDNCTGRDIYKVCPNFTNVIEFSSSSFYIAPNPADKYIHLYLNYRDTKSLQYTVYDILGNKILADVFIEGQQVLDIDISSLSKGTYFLKIEDNHASVTKLFVKN